MTFVLPKRFPTRKRRFDSAAALLPHGLAGLGLWRGTPWRVPTRGMGAAPSRAAQAIANAEGYGVAGSIPTRSNNPGDLEIGNIGYGVTIAAGGQQITNFPSADSGWTALQNQINRIASGTSSAGYQPGWTIAQVGQLYSGGSSAWANNVASSLGVSPDTPFSSVAGGVTGSVDTTSVDTSTMADDTLSTSPDAMSTSLIPSSGDNTGLIMAGIAAALVVGIYAFA